MGSLLITLLFPFYSTLLLEHEQESQKGIFNETASPHSTPLQVLLEYISFYIIRLLPIIPCLFYYFLRCFIKGLGPRQIDHLKTKLFSVVFNILNDFFHEIRNSYSRQVNRPFYSCLLSDLTYEWQRGCQ